MTALTSELLESLNDDQIDAFIEVMLWAASADGEIHEGEIAQVRKNLVEVDALWLSHLELDERLVRIHGSMTGVTRTKRLKAIKKILTDPQTRQAGLELAVRVTAADGVLRTSERDLILETAEALGVDPGKAADIVKSVGG